MSKAGGQFRVVGSGEPDHPDLHRRPAVAPEARRAEPDRTSPDGPLETHGDLSTSWCVPRDTISRVDESSSSTPRRQVISQALERLVALGEMNRTGADAFLGQYVVTDSDHALESCRRPGPI
jgi:hypothetical protein